MQSASSDIIVATNLQRTFGKGSGAVHVLKGVDIAIPSGSLIAFKGRSGSGKTTLINLLSALDRPNEGRIMFEGRDLSSMSSKDRDNVRRTRMGLIFQSFALLPLMSAYENVEFVLRVSGFPAKERKDAAIWALEQVGLKPRMNHRPFEMSGGEQQRTAIARAIAHKPSLLLADEPTAELDTKTGFQIMKAFRNLVETSGMSIIMTTHDPAIMEIVDHVYELEDGQIVVPT
ncbi:ABC transporter ATP-binding protein [Paenibacillus sp. GSMTC-2017]|uniref:ABC transporter ATP-binding protein n=1 Tax=Paenibacillus sp. GSMTC-2017 TaxID=2794350 RepID=UPI0018D7039D|nr:ABC transporter ATP-binding protein [Paenibacillus sp. GSMTC-2017]MBH5317403.1 ABC transporter ATP-binding protein [Paenibacillus sp. GSMTC-2017]